MVEKKHFKIETKNEEAKATMPSNGKSLDAAALEKLERASSVVNKLGWRRKREASSALFDALYGVLPKELAFRVATSITGIEPDPWRTASEAMDDLLKLGVKIYYKKLRRLYRKAIRAGGELVVAFNALGQWDSPDSTSLRGPLAILRIRVKGTVHFNVSPYLLND